jgi:hypothetical protein
VTFQFTELTGTLFLVCLFLALLIALSEFTKPPKE